MHAADGHEDGDVPIDVVTTHSQVASKLRASGELPAPSATSNSGEKVRGLSVSNRVGNMIDDMPGGEQQVASSKPMLQDYKKFKHGREVPQEAEIQYLKQHLLAHALVHHKHVMHMPQYEVTNGASRTKGEVLRRSNSNTCCSWHCEINKS